MVHRGILPFLPSILAAATGSFLADQAFFLIGRRFRSHAFVRKAQQRPAFTRALAAFDRNPTLFVFAFRFLYGLRTISPMAIGTTRLPMRTFLIANALAAIVWGAAFVSVGYCFGTAIEAAFGRLRSLEPVLLGIVAAALAIGLTARLLRRPPHET